MKPRTCVICDTDMDAICGIYCCPKCCAEETESAHSVVIVTLTSSTGKSKDFRGESLYRCFCQMHEVFGDQLFNYYEAQFQGYEFGDGGLINDILQWWESTEGRKIEVTLL